jgi:enediyne biosynthesis protein E3
MADSARRGFRLDRPTARVVLEAHARSFLTGFNLALAHPREVHDALTTVPEVERGFAYEGAGMYARLVDIATLGRTGALRRLIDGPGGGYVHLVHVGAGWGLVPTRIPIRVRLPRTPLLRWLALDGAGFGETYFGGVRALGRNTLGRNTLGRNTLGRNTLGRNTRGTPSPLGEQRWQIKISGCGRALWFVESADTDGITALIAGQPSHAQPWLWSGVGLAAGYAGATSADGLRRLADRAGDAFPFFAQGVVFATAARVISAVVPPHTELACRTVLGIDPDMAQHWSDTAAQGLTDSVEVTAYAEWRARLRARATASA